MPPLSSVILGCLLLALPLPLARAGQAPQAAGAKPEPRNVLLFTLDTTRADHLGCYGHAPAKTAAIDALAKRGVLFEQARTPVPMTLPAHATIMTGLLPCEHHVRDNGLFRVTPSAPTLALTLKAYGLDTAAFIGAYVLDASYGLDAGFDVYQGVKSKSVASVFEERPATAVTRDVLAWLDARKSDRPFFAWIHYFDAHAPYRSPLEQSGLHPYDAEIAFVSEQIQVVLDRLGPALADTLVVITADHGEGLGEHGEDSHGFFIYDSTMRVPLIFAHPSLAGGCRVAASVGLQDIARTVCEMLGLTPDPAMGGRSLAPALRGSELESAPQYLENYSTYLSYGWSPLLGLVAGDVKLIKAPRSELYLLRDDAHELNNALAGDAADRSEALARRARELTGMLDHIVADHPPRTNVADEIAMTEAARGQLQKLGYVGGRSRPPPESSRTPLADPKDKIELVRQHDRAYQLMKDGQQPQAVAVMKELVEQDPTNPQFLCHYGILLKSVGRFEDALAALQGAVDKGEQTATAYFNLGEVHQQLDQPEPAEKCFRQCLSTQPGHIGALQRLAEMLEQSGRPDEARRLYQTLLDSWEGEASFAATIKRRLDRLAAPPPASGK